MTEFTPGKSYIYSDEISSETLRNSQVELIDLLTIDLNDTDIKDFRQFLGQASQKPLGVNRLLWLKNGDNLSIIMQHMLLKITEEPPIELIIVLQAKLLDGFLPTLRSRLHQLTGTVQNLESNRQASFPGTYAELEKKLTALKDRASLSHSLSDELNNLKREMLSAPNTKTSIRINLLSLSIRRLGQNCNQKLIIDQVLLYWFGK